MSDQYQSPYGGQPSGGYPAGGFPAQASTNFPGGGPQGFPQAGPSPRVQAPGALAGPATAAPKSSRKAKRAKEPKEGQQPTRRIISRQFLLAGAFALVAGGLVVSFMTGSQDTVWVVRAKADIAAGTQISGSLLEAVQLPREAVEPNTFTATSGSAALAAADKGLGKVVAEYPLAAKEQIRGTQFGVQATLGADLQPNERLVSIHASVSTAVAGTLTVGDKVDIIGASDGWTKVVATNVPIVSIGADENLYNAVADQQSTNKNVVPSDVLPGDPVPGIYVVKVPADLMPSLVNWDQSATLHLAYRSPNSTDVPLADNFLNDAAAQSAAVGAGKH